MNKDREWQMQTYFRLFIFISEMMTIAVSL